MFHILELSSDAKLRLQRGDSIQAPLYPWIKDDYEFVYFSSDDEIIGYGELCRFKGSVRIENTEWYGTKPKIQTKTLRDGTLVSDAPLVLIPGVVNSFKNVLKQVPLKWEVALDDFRLVAYDPDTGSSKRITGVQPSDIRSFIAAGYLVKTKESDDDYPSYTVKRNIA